MYHLWFICFYMKRLGSTKKGKAQALKHSPTKGESFREEKHPIFAPAILVQISNQPNVRASSDKRFPQKSTGFFKDPVFVRLGWEHWQPLRYTHLKPINCKPLFFGGAQTTLLGMVIMVMFHGGKTQAQTHRVIHGLTLINLATLDKRRPRSTIPGRHACTTGNWLANLWIDRMWPVRWKMKDEAHKYQVPVWCQTNYTFVWDVDGQTARTSQDKT